MQSILKFEKETYAIRGAAFEVYSVMGKGFLEAVYQECLQIEFAARGVPFLSQVQLSVSYKGTELQQHYRPDFICFGMVVVEIKSVSLLINEHRAQLMNYLKATGFPIGILLNFGHHPLMEVERFVM